MSIHNNKIYHKLTGQDVITPNIILEHISYLLSRRGRVNLNYIIVPGVNDTNSILWDYLGEISKYPINSVRFMLQSATIDNSEHDLIKSLNLTDNFVTDRGERIKRYQTKLNTTIEIVKCESKIGDIICPKSDLYFSTRGSFKIGLLGQEIFFENLNDFKQLVMNYIE